jgi:hypothetical protein
VSPGLARRLLSSRGQEDTHMKGNKAVALVLTLAAVLVATAANAAPPTRDEIQAPRGEDRVEAPRR